MATFAKLIGEKIQLHRSARNMTQKKLEDAIGMSGTYLAQIERGEKNVKLSTIEKIATGLHMTVHDFFEEKEGTLQDKKWLWASVLLLLQQDEIRQRQAYRVLEALLTNEAEK